MSRCGNFLACDSELWLVQSYCGVLILEDHYTYSDIGPYRLARLKLVTTGAAIVVIVAMAVAVTVAVVSDMAVIVAATMVVPGRSMALCENRL
jgi:hypothetical protein